MRVERTVTGEVSPEYQWTENLGNIVIIVDGSDDLLVDTTTRLVVYHRFSSEDHSEWQLEIGTDTWTANNPTKTEVGAGKDQSITGKYRQQGGMKCLDPLALGFPEKIDPCCVKPKKSSPVLLAGASIVLSSSVHNGAMGHDLRSEWDLLPKRIARNVSTCTKKSPIRYSYAAKERIFSLTFSLPASLCWSFSTDWLTRLYMPLWFINLHVLLGLLTVLQCGRVLSMQNRTV